LKKDRNCGGAYPVYPQMVPNYNGIVAPGQVIPLPGNPMMNVPMNVPTTVTTGSSALETQVNNLSNQVNNLEQRVTRLESMVSGSANNYNPSNYQMM